MIYFDMNNYIKRIYHGGGNPYSILHTALINLTESTEFVCDTASSRKPRRAIHPGYKKGRDFGDDPVYFEVLNNCKEMALCFANAKIVDVENGEADDYIANKAELSDTVISNDRDLWPLLDRGVTIRLNASTKVDLDAVYTKFNTTKPKHIYLYKALVGDTSDKIPGKRGFGEAAWKKLSEGEREAIYRALKDNKPLEPLINDQVKMCWELARPISEDHYDVVITQPKERNVLDFCEEKGIVL